MIPADVVAKIRRLFHAERWPVGTIARHLGLHHSTVRRVLRDDGVPTDAVARRPSMADPFVPFIVQTLETWPDLRASRLYEMVKQRGYKGAPDHFRAIVARYRPRPAAEAFLRLTTLPGEQAQVDWASFGHLDVEGARRPLVAFVLVLSWSRRIALRFGCDQRTGAFLAHHEAAFEDIGGVPRTVLYDNLKSAVIERVGDAIRFNDNLLAFAALYRFEPRPVAPYRGNEKGRVERAIRYVRDAFWPARSWHDLADLNAQAAQWCREVADRRRHPEDRTRTIAEAFADEKDKLLPLPHDRFPVADRVEVRVGKTPYARFDGNDYSVPHDRVRRTLVVLADHDAIRILDGTEEVARHDRCWGKGRQVEIAAHLEALVHAKHQAHEARGMNKLARAVPGSRALLDALAMRGGNLGSSVAQLGKLLDAFGPDELGAAIAEAMAADRPHVAAVRHVLDRRAHERGEPPPLPVPLPDDPRVRDLVVKPHALATYDSLRRKDDDDE